MSETRLPGWAYRTRTRKCRFDPARFASVPSRRPRKVSGTKMLCKPKEFARDYKKPTFPSSSPTWPATQSGLVVHAIAEQLVIGAIPRRAEICYRLGRKKVVPTPHPDHFRGHDGDLQ